MTMKKEADGEHPASHYLVVEKPDEVSTWHLRYKDVKGNVDRGLCGAAFAALTSNYRGHSYSGPSKDAALSKLKGIYKSRGWPLPDAKMAAGPDDVEKGRSALKSLFDQIADSLGLGGKAPEPATFSATFAADDAVEDGEDMVLTGRLFQAGEYPDVAFAMTPAELYQTIQGFLEPVPFDLEHKPLFLAGTDLTGMFGQVEAVWADDDWMMARARKPRWLHQIMPETQVSATFSREDKSLIGAAWTATPRVNGAELVAAFAKSLPDGVSDDTGAFQLFIPNSTFAGTRHDTPSGQMVMQRIHNAAVSGGAVCKRVGMASRHESQVIQQVHDLAVSHGASCETSGSMPAMYSNDKPKGRTTMGLKDLFSGMARDKGGELDPADAARLEALDKLDPAAFSGEPDPAVAELKAKLEAEQAENKKIREEHTAAFARMDSERRHAEAVTFAQSQVAAKRVTPAAAELLVPLAERIAAADSTVTFAEGEVPTSKLLADFIGKLPDFSLFTTEQMKDEKVAALFSQTKTDDGTEKPPTDERVAELMKLYPEGRNGAASKA